MSGGAWHLSHPRPWKAVPMDPKHPEREWKVIAPSKTGIKGDWAEVVSYMSEADAKTIAAASYSDGVPA